MLNRRLLATGFLLISLCVALAGAFFQRHSLACELLPVLNHPKIGDGVYFAGTPNAEEAAEILRLVTEARKRIEASYGAPVAIPRVVVTPTREAARRWGSNETASMHRAPHRACVVIGPEGQNVDVIAHELLHAEIMHRIGLVRFLTEIPVWFDEGAALTVDYRAPFLPENIELSESDVQAVKHLVKGRDFFSGDVRKHYQAARLAVESLVDAASFFHDLERIANGESFEQVFLSRALESGEPTP